MAGLTCHLRGTLLNCAIRACHPNTYRIYIFPNNHRSGKRNPFWRQNSPSRDPFATSMLGGGRVYIYIFLFLFMYIYIYMITSIVTKHDNLGFALAFLRVLKMRCIYFL